MSDSHSSDRRDSNASNKSTRSSNGGTTSQLHHAQRSSNSTLKSRTSSITSQPICPDDLKRALDPQIQIELDRMNQTSNNINQIENKLETARSEYRAILSHSSNQLERCSTRLGSCVSKARPYYIAKHEARQAQKRAQEATIKYERAVSCHEAAREMVSLAEQNMRNNGVDLAWHQMLNHATNRVNEAEIERELSNEDVSKCTIKAIMTQTEVHKLMKILKNYIEKSREYFELKNLLCEKVDSLQRRVKNYENSLGDAKISYKTAMRSLEHISERIHAARKSQLELKRIGPEGLNSIEPGKVNGKSGKVFSGDFRIPEGGESVEAFLEKTRIGGNGEKEEMLEESQSVVEIALAKHLEARNKEISGINQRRVSSDFDGLSIATCQDSDNTSEIIYADLHRKDYLDDVDGAQGREYVKQKSKSNSLKSSKTPINNTNANPRPSLSLDIRKEKNLDDALACMKIEKEAGSLRKPLGREISGPISGTIPKYVVKNNNSKNGANLANKIEESEQVQGKSRNVSRSDVGGSNDGSEASSVVRVGDQFFTGDPRTRTKSSSSSHNVPVTPTASVPLTLSIKDLMNR